MADVFISYHEKSAGELVEQIADALNATGISCWCARRDLPPGAAFSDYIPQAIRDCKAFLLVLNEESNQSEHVKNELNLAFRRINQHEQITLIPFQVDNCVVSDSVDYFINRFQIINATPPNEENIRKLVEQIAAILGKKPSPKIIQSGFCGDNVTYTLNENGILTISGTGKMMDYSWVHLLRTYDVPWQDERDTISFVQIQDGVTSIGDCAFCLCGNLTGITIPDSVTEIGQNAFGGCSDLTNISIPNSVIKIGMGAFHATGLTNVTIPNSITSIEDYTFDHCLRLRNIDISNSVTYIGSKSFRHCWGLTNIVIPDSVAFIAHEAFHGTNLRNVSIPANVRISLSSFEHVDIITRREQTNSPGK